MFSPPANDGGSPINGYTAICNIGGFSATGTTSPILVSGLTNGTTYNCQVSATNAFGSGPLSATAMVTPIGNPQSITFGSVPVIVVGGTGMVSATGGASGNPVTFTSTTTSVCTVSGTTVTGVSAGSCIIAANQAGNANYNAAPQATQTFSIGLTNQAITFGTAPTVVVGGTGTVSATGGASGNPVVFTSATTAVCTVSGSTVTGVTAGTCTIRANQAGNARYSAAPQETQTFRIGLGNQAIACIVV